MEKRSFTIVIDSLKRISGNTNDCVIKINCPQSFNKLFVEVLLFSIAYPTVQLPTASYIKLTSSDLIIYDQYSNNNQNVITIYDNRNYRYSRNSFFCDNFNNKEMHFRLVDENDNLLLNGNATNFNLPWVVILKCTEI